MARAAAVAPATRALLDEAVARVVYRAERSGHKGQAGRVGVVGGSLEYTGAPYYAAMAALRGGADLAFVFCASRDAALPIKSYSPELIVFPHLADATGDKLARLSALVVGPGLGRDPGALDTVRGVIGEAAAKRIPVVLDGDALWMLKDHPEVARAAPPGLLAVTPNKVEFDRLYRAATGAKPDAEVPPPMTREAGGAPGPVKDEASELVSRWLGGALVLRKGAVDVITDATRSVAVAELGSTRRCGGQGDVLAGLLGLTLGWVKDPKDAILAAVTASVVTRQANALAFREHGRSTTTPEIIAKVGDAFRTVLGEDERREGSAAAASL